MRLEARGRSTGISLFLHHQHSLRASRLRLKKGLTGLSHLGLKPLSDPYVIYITTKIFMLVVLRVKKSSSISMEEFFFWPAGKIYYYFGELRRLYFHLIHALLYMICF